MINTYEDKLKNINLPFFPKYIDWSAPLAVKEKLSEMGRLGYRSFFGSILKVIVWSLIDNKKYSYNNKTDSNVLFFYGKWNYRLDHHKVFENFVKKLGKYDYIIADKTRYYITPIRFIRNVILTIIWLIKILFSDLSIIEGANLLPLLIKSYDLIKYLNNNIQKNYKICITYYDVSPDENIFIQYCKNKLITTCTMQHGIFAKKDIIRSIPDTAVELEKSISDYYLAWNLYTRDQAIKVGLDSRKIKILGIPKYIENTTYEDLEKPKKGIFGVMLNNSEFHTHNVKLIEMANCIANKSGNKYVIRYHPVLDKTVYKDIIDNEYYLEESSNQLSIIDYIKTVDFTIISSSSVFVDLVFIKHKVYRLIVSDQDTYSGIEYHAFKECDTFVNSLLTANEVISENEYNYICGPSNVKKSYNDFINSILI